MSESDFESDGIPVYEALDKLVEVGEILSRISAERRTRLGEDDQMAGILNLLAWTLIPCLSFLEQTTEKVDSLIALVLDGQFLEHLQYFRDSIEMAARAIEKEEEAATDIEERRN